MRLSKFLALSVCATMALASPSAAQRNVEPGQPPHPAARTALPTIIHAGHLMVEPGKPVLANATLVTVDGKVHSVHEGFRNAAELGLRSEEHTSELQSLMRISYAVFCLKKKTTHNYILAYETNHE